MYSMPPIRLHLLLLLLYSELIKIYQQSTNTRTIVSSREGEKKNNNLLLNDVKMCLFSTVNHHI